jgi:predicted nucleic acid-binding protein
MTFVDILKGSSVFVDANTFVYHFAPDPLLGDSCTDLLVRIKRKEIEGFTSTHILSELAHRLMTIEAMRTQGWAFAGIAAKLRHHPDVVKKLSAFRQAVQEVPQFGIQVLAIPPPLVELVLRGD